jgi:hypothetical protein
MAFCNSLAKTGQRLHKNGIVNAQKLILSQHTLKNKTQAPKNVSSIMSQTLCHHRRTLAEATLGMPNRMTPLQLKGQSRNPWD